MAEMMQFDLVSPERAVASMQVSAVQIPGADGDMTAMAAHAPTITTLRPGVLKADGPDGAAEYVVTGGFAEISSAGVSVLAEQAIARTDMTQEQMDTIFDAAQSSYAQAKESGSASVDAAAKLLSDVTAMGTQIGLTTKAPTL